MSHSKVTNNSEGTDNSKAIDNPEAINNPKAMNPSKTKSQTKTMTSSKAPHVPPEGKAQTSTLKKKVGLFLKAALVLGLLFFLMKRGFISLSATKQALSQWQRIVPAFLGMIFTMFLGVIRWQWLLEAHRIHLKWFRTFQLTLIGIFFNLALPGAVSGDIVKAFYIGKEIKGKRSQAFGSILFDRVAGLSALVFVSAGALLMGFKSFSNSMLLNGIQFFMVFSAISVAVFYGYLFLVRPHHDPLLKILRTCEKRFPKFESITRIYEGLRHYHNHRTTVLKVLAISILIHITVGWSCYNLALAIQESSLSLLSVYVVAPLGLLVTAVPIAPAGVGTGNVAFLYFFSLIGFNRGADVYSLYALMNILIGCFGGLIYSRFKSHEHPMPAMQECEA